MKGYSMLNVNRENIPERVVRYGHYWELAGGISADGSFAGGTRNRKQAEGTADAYRAKHQNVPTSRGFVRWKAIIVPYIAKATYHWHVKGEKFYIVYIRRYVSKS